jgi:hypothetical protein
MVAWVRRVRTASGATAVQIAESVEGRRRIVRHVGSARDEADLGLLMEQAQRLLADDAQGVLDLGITPVAAKAVMLARCEPRGLFAGPAGAPAVRPMVSRSRVLKTSSGLLYEALAGVYTSLGFDVVGEESFRDLVIARIVEPTSLLDVDRVLAEMGRRAVSLSTRKRTLRRCHQGEYRDQIAAACFAHAVTAGDVSLVLYDVTTLYFEAEKEDEGANGLRKVGYSKERRVDPQIVVGLLVDRHGFPLEIGCYEGNKAETLTIVPIVKQFQARHGLADMVVVADAGMLSSSNLRQLDEANLRFIVGARVTKAPKDLESHFRWHGDAFVDGQVIDTITPRTGHKIENDPRRKAEPAWDRAQHPGSWRAVWAYSTKRAVRDNKTLTLQENRAKAVVAGETPARTPRFVKTTNGAARLDEASLARARRLVGLKGYVTNIPAALMPAGEVIASYHDLWHVEQSFRMSKADLAARPMFARTRDAIEAHLTIVFTALAVSRTVQDRTGLSLRRVLRTLKPLRSATVEINGVISTIPPALGPDETAILDALEHPNPRH